MKLSLYTISVDSFIFDIETVGEDFSSIDPMTQGELTKWIKKEAKTKTEYELLLQNVKEGLSLSPLTGEIVAIGVYSCNSDRGAVYYQAPGETNAPFDKDTITYKQMTEKDMISKFWELTAQAQEMVSFNGRSFDVPYIMLRSAIHHIRPSRDLMSNRYVSMQRGLPKHIDLFDQMTFYGVMSKKGSLHIFARAFGIESPKSEEVNGNQVASMFAKKRFLDIAKYNGQDIKATKKLFTYWDKYLRF